MLKGEEKVSIPLEKEGDGVIVSHLDHRRGGGGGAQRVLGPRFFSILYSAHPHTPLCN